MKKGFFILFTVSILIICQISPSYAIWQRLNERQIQQAISYGNLNAKGDPFEFMKNWIVDLGGYNGSAMLITEFLRLAFASRESANQGRDFTNYDIQDALSESRGRLVFAVSLFGSSPDFAKDYSANLMVGNKSVEVSFFKNPPGEQFGDGVKVPAYVSDCEYWFSSKDIDPNAVVTLVVTSMQGKKMEFVFDLSRMQ